MFCYFDNCVQEHLSNISSNQTSQMHVDNQSMLHKIIFLLIG